MVKPEPHQHSQANHYALNKGNHIASPFSVIRGAVHVSSLVQSQAL